MGPAPSRRGPMGRPCHGAGPSGHGTRPLAMGRERFHARRAEMIEKFKEHAKAMFEKADANKDGKLSQEEAPERLKQNFSKIDGDGDGQLTPEELKKAWQERVKAAGKADPDKAAKPDHPKKDRDKEGRAKKGEAKKDAPAKRTARPSRRRRRSRRAPTGAYRALRCRRPLGVQVRIAAHPAR